MSEQGVVGAHFQSDGMDVQPKEEKGKTVPKGDHHGEGMQDSAASPHALEQIQVAASVPKHMVVKTKELEAGSSSSNQSVPQRSMHFGPPVGTTLEASTSKARFDGIAGLRQEFDEPQDGTQNEPQGGSRDQGSGLQQVLEKLDMNQWPGPENFRRKFQYFQCRGIRDEEHYKRLGASEKNKEKNKKDIEGKVRRAFMDTINGGETYTKSTAIKSITDAICSYMGVTVKWSDAKGGRNHPQDTAQSASKKLRPDEEAPVVRRVVKDERKGDDEGMQPTQTVATPDATLSTTDAVYSVSLAAQCFDRAYLSTGAKQLNLRCGTWNPSGTFSREPDLLVSLFTRFGNYQRRAYRKVDHVKPEGEHATDDLSEIVPSPGVRDYACVTVGVTQHQRHGYMDFYIQGPATMKKVLGFYGLRYLQPGQVVDLSNGSVIWSSQ